MVLVPFLGSVDDIVLAVSTLGSGSDNVGDITPSLWLGNSDTPTLLAGKQIREEAFL